MSQRVLCFGDSNTWGFQPGLSTRYPESIRWTGKLAYELGPSVTVLEAGLNARTTVFDDPLRPYANGRTGLLQDLVEQKPLDLVVLSLGTNDLKYTGAAGSAKGLRDLLNILYHTDAFLYFGCPVFPNPPKVLVISPIHISPELDRINPQSELRGKAEESKNFFRFFEPVCRQFGAELLDASLYAGPSEIDGVHMSAESHLALGRAIAEKVKQML